ncbi:acyltransferase family protein [Bacillus idriensis]|uniref:Acyltransferase family protein n=1 Tax=Metabacillus idriensis TaxID=324768 RepID=A0A6I2M4Y6_9BACI|nr:acyltransferase family protein [Metabacillus idriensis]MRX52394.1 acyltransferase family protein [Metabacillus idriensis]
MERNYAIDFIKFFAIFAVVVIHTFPLDSQIELFILDNLFRFAVPFFFVASGYLFGNKIINTRESVEYFKRYVIKIIKIYVCWLIFYTIYDVLVIYLSDSNVLQKLMKYFDEFTMLNLFYFGKGTSGYQLWFLTSLIWSIIILYIIYRLKKINFLLTLSFILNIIGLFGQSYSMFFKLPISTRDAVFFGLFYTTLGFFFALHSQKIKSLKINATIYLYLFVVFSFLQVMEGYILEKKLSSSHGEYFISTIFLTVFLFSFALNFSQLGKGMLITKIGSNALGIYIIHVFFIKIMDMGINILGLKSMTENLIWPQLYSLFIFVISYLAYNGIQSLKLAFKGQE